MKRVWLLLLLAFNSAPSMAAKEPVIHCKILQGYFDHARLLFEQDSGRETDFYGSYDHPDVHIIWGVNIGAGPSSSSQGRFQILVLPQDYATTGRGMAMADSGASKVDIGLTLPAVDLTIQCQTH